MSSGTKTPSITATITASPPRRPRAAAPSISPRSPFRQVIERVHGGERSQDGMVRGEIGGRDEPDGQDNEKDRQVHVVDRALSERACGRGAR